MANRRKDDVQSIDGLPQHYQFAKLKTRKEATTSAKQISNAEMPTEYSNKHSKEN